MEKDIIFGTWQITDADTCRDAVSTALHAGYRHIDTAADMETLATLPGLISHRYGDPQPYESR